MSTAARVSAPRRVPWALSSSGAALLLALTGAAVPSAAAAPHAPDIARASVATGGQQGNGTAEWPAISADGHSVAFTSAADNLVPHDTNGVADVFVRDLRTGRTQRIAQGPANTPALSGDGRYVAFVTTAALAEDDDNGFEDVYVHDRRTHRTEHISTGNAVPVQGTWPNRSPAISANGRYVAYSTTATDINPEDTSTFPDVVVHDRRTGHKELVRYHTDGTLGEGHSTGAALSADGRYVVFQTPTHLDPSHDYTHGHNVYVRDRLKGITEQVSLPARFVHKEASSSGSISADGRYVAFVSRINSLVSGDTNKTYDIFLFDRKTKTTTRVSTAADGTQTNAPSTYATLSADGRRVAFVSQATNLVPDDTNGVADIFVKDLRTGEVERVSRAADGGQADGASGPVQLGQGRIVFSSSAANLVPRDTNGVDDIFVRKVR